MKLKPGSGRLLRHPALCQRGKRRSSKCDSRWGASTAEQWTEMRLYRYAGRVVAKMFTHYNTGTWQTDRWTLHDGIGCSTAQQKW